MLKTVNNETNKNIISSGNGEWWGLKRNIYPSRIHHTPIHPTPYTLHTHNPARNRKTSKTPWKMQVWFVSVWMYPMDVLDYMKITLANSNIKTIHQHTHTHWQEHQFSIVLFEQFLWSNICFCVLERMEKTVQKWN